MVVETRGSSSQPAAPARVVSASTRRRRRGGNAVCGRSVALRPDLGRSFFFRSNNKKEELQRCSDRLPYTEMATSSSLSEQAIPPIAARPAAPQPAHQMAAVASQHMSDSDRAKSKMSAVATGRTPDGVVWGIDELTNRRRPAENIESSIPSPGMRASYSCSFLDGSLSPRIILNLRLDGLTCACL